MTSAEQIQIDHIGPDDYAVTIGGRTVGYVKVDDAGGLRAQFAGESADFSSLDEVRGWFVSRVDAPSDADGTVASEQQPV